MDWDGTLRRGLLLRDWIEHLQATRLIDRGRFRGYLDTVDAYLSGDIDYARFVLDAPANYGDALRDMPTAEIDQAIRPFVSEDLVKHRIHPFVRPLMALLSEHSIDAVVISGSPQDLIQEYAEPLGLTRIIGLKTGRVRGRYSGVIVENPATFEAKLAAVNRFKQYEIVLGIGDTDADYPLLAGAKARVVVGNGLSCPLVEPTLVIQPEVESPQSQTHKVINFVLNQMQGGC